MQRRKLAGAWLGIHVVGVGGGGRRTIERLSLAGNYHIHYDVIDAGGAGVSGLEERLAGASLVFVIAGLGGRTGSRLAPEVATVARRRGALVVAIVTLPFTFEGAGRAGVARQGLDELQKTAHTVVTIPNDRILEYAGGSLAFHETSALADQLCDQVVGAIVELVTQCGLINVDLADVQRVLGNNRMAFVGTGAGRGEARGQQAAEKAVACDVLGTSIDNATDLLVNVRGGTDLTLADVQQVATVVKERIAREAMTVYGATIDPALEDEVRVTLVATGGNAGGRFVAESARVMERAARYAPRPSAPAGRGGQRAELLEAPGWSWASSL
jgi:cell division protein FtsZ